MYCWGTTCPENRHCCARGNQGGGERATRAGAFVSGTTCTGYHVSSRNYKSCLIGNGRKRKVGWVSRTLDEWPPMSAIPLAWSGGKVAVVQSEGAVGEAL